MNSVVEGYSPAVRHGCGRAAGPRAIDPAGPASDSGSPAAADCPAASGSDSLNISPRTRWVVCPLGSTRGPGTAGGLFTPGGFENTEKKIPRSNGRFPAALPLGQQREEQGDLFIFSLALLAMFW